MIKVLHTNNPTFFAPKEPVVRLVEYTHVADVDSNDLEVAFELTNSIDRQWWENVEVKFRGSLQHGRKGSRSTSVGDIMQIEDGSYWVVSSFGFNQIEVV